MCSSDETDGLSTLEKCANHISRFAFSPLASIVAVSTFAFLALLGIVKVVRSRRTSPQIPYSSPLTNAQVLGYNTFATEP